MQDDAITSIQGRGAKKHVGFIWQDDQFELYLRQRYNQTNVQRWIEKTKNKSVEVQTRTFY